MSHFVSTCAQKEKRAVCGSLSLLSFLSSLLNDNRQIPAHKVSNDYGHRKEEVPVVIGDNGVEEIENGVSKVGGIDREHIADPDNLAVEIKEICVIDRKVDEVNNGICAEGYSEGGLDTLGIELCKAELEHNDRNTYLKDVGKIEEVEGPVEEHHLL